MLIVLQRHIHEDIFQLKKIDSLEEVKAIQLKEFADSDTNSRNEAVSKLVEHVQEVTSNINQFGLDYLTAR